jgi:hypothetical protein
MGILLLGLLASKREPVSIREKVWPAHKFERLNDFINLSALSRNF